MTTIKGKWDHPVQVRWKREEDEVLRERWGVDRPVAIATVLGRSVQSVFNRAARLGLPPNRRRRSNHEPRKRSPRAISQPKELSPRDREIVAAVRDGDTYESVGHRFSLSRERIRQIASAQGVKNVNRHALSDDEIAGYIEQYSRGVPFAHMSPERSGSSIASALARRGIHDAGNSRPPDWNSVDTELLKGLWGHLPCAEIAKVIGTTKNAVIGRARRLGLPSMKPAPARELVDA